MLAIFGRIIDHVADHIPEKVGLRLFYIQIVCTRCGMSQTIFQKK